MYCVYLKSRLRILLAERDMTQKEALEKIMVALEVNNVGELFQTVDEADN